MSYDLSEAFIMFTTMMMLMIKDTKENQHLANEIIC